MYLFLSSRKLGFNQPKCVLLMHTDQRHHISVCLCLNSGFFVSRLRGVGGGWTYILHPSLRDDLMGHAAAITVLAGVNRNSM